MFDLLKCASVLIRNFRDAIPISDWSEDRDYVNITIKWNSLYILIRSEKTLNSKEKCTNSHQTREDIISSIMGFEKLCVHKFKYSYSSVIPGRVNSDIIENIFCQQRTLIMELMQNLPI